MKGTLSQFINAIPDSTMARKLQFVLEALCDRMACAMLASAAIVINGASAVFPKTGATAVYALVSNALVAIGAGTALPSPVGTVAQNTFNVFCYYIDVAGALTVLMGTPATTLAGVVFPDPPQGKTMIGGFSVNPTTASFIGGTTALDAANTNVVYFSPVGAFDPSIFVGNF